MADNHIIQPHNAHLTLKTFTPKVIATYNTESNHLINKNRRVVDLAIEKLSRQAELSQDELIDAYISLHILLEVGANAVLRKLALDNLKKAVDPYVAMRHLDEIGFREKITSLIYFGTYNFGDELETAEKNVTVIEEIKKFCEPRNKLLHGHAIIAAGDLDRSKRGTAANKLLNNELFIEQLARYSDIVNRLYFFLGRLYPTPTKIEDYKILLDNNFIPQELISKSSKT